MPGYNGFEVAERIRETDKHVLIFFLSDRSDKADRLQGFQLRANDYLAKPFYPEELIARIHERFTSQLSDTVEEETYRFGQSVFQMCIRDSFLDRPFQDYLEWFTARPLACRIFNGYSRTILHSVRLDTFQGTPPYLERLLLLHRYFARCHFHC